MKLNEIHIRDPFILPFDGKYYLYGSRGFNHTGFDVYTSSDLENWSESKTVFEYFDGFWGTKEFWAPEVHMYNGKFYMFAIFHNDECCRGTMILVSDTPDGTFRPITDAPVTPPDWECLDGTFYLDENNTPYMVFCHEWVQIKNGTVCAIKLSPDLKTAESDPSILWSAGDASWVKSVMDEGNFVTDGPFIIRLEDELLSIWSSFSKEGYAEAIARSDNGKINGKWSIDDKLLFEKDGGHGMIFKGYDGEDYFIFHTPNTILDERPCIKKINLDNLKK